MTVRLSVDDLHKSFDTVPVLTGVSLELRGGETHALLGENGSGKSTLVKILSGYHSADRGRILLDGVQLDAAQMRDRVTVIHQDLGLIESLSVLDNIAVGVGFSAGAVLPIRRRALRRRVAEALSFIGSDLDLDLHVDQLTAPERTMVGVARAVMRLDPARASEALFILDEPTAVATAEQATTIMTLMRDMAAMGASVMFITHRVHEALASDRVTVLRDGRIALDAAAAGISDHDVIDAMLGRRLDAYYPDKPPVPAASEPVLSCTGLSGEVLKDFALELRAGEIAGITGIGGMGQDEVPLLLAGLAQRGGGTVVLDGVALGSYENAIAAGLALVPANRRRDGGWREGTAQENLTLPSMARVSRRWHIDARAERRMAAEIMERTGTRPADPKKHFGTFSGGNQQKLVMGKWLHRSPRVLILHEPTQGVDVGARRDLLLLVSDAVASGTAVLVCSNDFEQLAEICQRVLVLSEGRVVTELSGAEVTAAAIASAAQLVSP